jgi:hypothetical protein
LMCKTISRQRFENARENSPCDHRLKFADYRDALEAVNNLKVVWFRIAVSEKKPLGVSSNYCVAGAKESE